MNSIKREIVLANVVREMPYVNSCAIMAMTGKTSSATNDTRSMSV